jgi:hypothetical protein
MPNFTSKNPKLSLLYFFNCTALAAQVPVLEPNIENCWIDKMKMPNGPWDMKVCAWLYESTPFSKRVNSPNDFGPFAPLDEIGQNNEEKEYNYNFAGRMLPDNEEKYVDN